MLHLQRDFYVKVMFNLYFSYLVWNFLIRNTEIQS